MDLQERLAALAAKMDEERVIWAFRCPNCDETRMDNLISDDEDWCTCQTCGQVYDPVTREEKEA